MDCQSFIIICLIILVVIYYLPKNKNDKFKLLDTNYQRISMLDNQPASGFMLDTSAPYR